MSLQQRLSPQQVMLSTLLQLPLLRLEQRIKLELQENPLLEEVLEDEMELDEEEEVELSLEQDQPEDGKEKKEEEEKKDEKDEETDGEIDWDLLGDEDEFEFRIPKDPNVEEYERPNPSRVTLSEHLLEQLHVIAGISEREIMIGEYIIWNIDEDGYFNVALEEIALNLEATVEEIENVLKMIQSFEPVGIAARDLRECLLIQLNERNDSSVERQILSDHFDDFKNKRFEKISKKLEISLDDLKEALAEIGKLNPKPGEGYISQDENYVIPDVIVERVDDEFVVSLNDSNIPALRINRGYRQLLSNTKKVPSEVKSFIRKRLESARWLINSIHQRRATIFRVMSAIVEKQHDFFEKGPGLLKPMILKDIAEHVNMDISTISRVTNGKYVQTDFGVFELKYFFTERMTTSDGEEVSNKKIKDLIHKIIDNEDSTKPLNDQTIVKILEEEGYPIARRTVAKYREQMKIPVARMRRQI
jgi:RNA polymerase sigma-54 factor